MLRAILFDWNGVLLDDEPARCASFQRALLGEGIVVAERDYYRRYAGRPDRAALSQVLAAAGSAADGLLLARLLARKAAFYQEQAQRQRLPLFAGAIELAKAAAGERLMLGVVSGALHAEVAAGLRAAGIAGLFKTLITAEDTRHGKPDPEGYQRAMQELNARPPLPERLLHPHEVLAIEDTPAGLVAARAAGLLTLGVAHPYSGLGAGETAALEADWVVPHLDGACMPWLLASCGEVGQA